MYANVLLYQGWVTPLVGGPDAGKRKSLVGQIITGHE